MWGLEKDLENAHLLNLDGYMVPLSFPSDLVVKNPPASQELQKTWILSMGWEDPLEESMTTRFSIFAWRIPWTEEPCGPQHMGHKESDMTEAT